MEKGGSEGSASPLRGIVGDWTKQHSLRPLGKRLEYEMLRMNHRAERGSWGWQGGGATARLLGHDWRRLLGSWGRKVTSFQKLNWKARVFNITNLVLCVVFLVLKITLQHKKQNPAASDLWHSKKTSYICQ